MTKLDFLCAALLAAVGLVPAPAAWAHPLTFSGSISYSDVAPQDRPDAIRNRTGATFDAGNVGGSGVNADGGNDNGTANDASTVVGGPRPLQGQTFRTGAAANGYDLTAVTVRMAGYAHNVVTESNHTAWDFNAKNGPVFVNIVKVDGDQCLPVSYQPFIAGGTGTPGAGRSASGAGTCVTFHLPFKVHLEPNQTYGFDLAVGNGSDNHFEWLGTTADVFAGGAAYRRDGVTVTPLTGDRVFHLELAASTTAATFAHPGALHTAADLDRMRAKVAAGEQPWKASFDLLEKMPYAQPGWPARPVETIIRGVPGNNYTRSQEDAAAIYELALRWHLTGNATYADAAVAIANAWGRTLKQLGGNSNVSLGAGIVGFQLACGAELLSTYPGWTEPDKQAFKDMMMRVFYPANLDFLWRHHDTFRRMGGNTHYRLNWDTCNMASMLAIGVLCDNRAVYAQAVDYFKYGPGNGRIERAAWYLHPNGLAQTEEMGRDQGHNLGGLDFLARMCQVAWNQGDDLYGYDNNRVLRALEYNAKYNLGEDVPYVPHRNTSLKYTEGGLGDRGRGNFVPMYEMVYHHYVNVKGIDAPYSRLAAERGRPEGGPNRRAHPSTLDWFGFGSLTFTRDPIATRALPHGLRANWSNGQVTLNWWGTANATGYNVKRATTPRGPLTTIGTTGDRDTFFVDADVTDGQSYYYVVSAVTLAGETGNSDPLAVKQSLVAHYAFEGNLKDGIGHRDGTGQGGATGAAMYADGRKGKAIGLDGVDDHVQLPAGIANHQDLTVSTWVYWEGGSHWQRVFDFGSDVEKSMFLTPSAGNDRLQFVITSTRSTEGTGRLEGPALPVGRWAHVAVTLKGDTGTLYVDGEPVDSQTIDSVDPLFSQPYCYLGRSMYNADPLLKGRLDDFRIYNHALTPEAVRALANE